MVNLLNILLIIVGFGIIASIFVLMAYYLSKRKLLDSKFSYCLALTISLAIITSIVLMLSDNVEYFLFGLVYSILCGMSTYFWLKHKKIS